MSQIKTKFIANNAVSNAKLAQMAGHSYKGNNTGVTANALDVTSTQLTADLNLFTSSLQGLVPASGGGTTSFLRADGTFAVPAGTSTGTVTSVALADSTGLFNITGSPVTTSGTLTLSSFQSQSQNRFLAAPNGSSGAPTFRLIVAADVPTLNQNTTGTASNVTGIVAIANGGTGQSTKTAGFDALQPMTTGGDIIYGGASGTGLRLANGTNGQFLTSSGGTSAPTWTTGNAGTVTSVALTVPSFLSVSGSPITSSGTLAVTLATESANFVFAGPTTGAASAPTFRALVSADIPANSANTTGTSSNVTGIVAIANGGTGQSTKAAGFDALAPTTTKGDLIAYSTTNARVAVGTNGQVLTSDSTQATGVSWQTPSSSTRVLMFAHNPGVSTTANTTITNWTVVKDSNSAMNGSTGVYTVPVAGDYYVSVQTQLNTNNNADPQIRKNGTIILEGSSITAAAGEGNVHGLVVNCLVNDTITVTLAAGPYVLANNVNVNFWSLFSM